MHGKKLPLYWELYQHKQGKYYQNQLHETVKKYIKKRRNVKAYCLRQPYGHCLLVTTNLATMALEYFNSWDSTAYGLSQTCTAGITEPLWLSRDLVCKDSTYFLDGSYQPCNQIFLNIGIQERYEKLHNETTSTLFELYLKTVGIYAPDFRYSEYVYFLNLAY